MNGEICDLCLLALSANKALHEHTVFSMPDAQYIAERRFVFSDGFGFADSSDKWFRISQKRGMKYVRLFLPDRVKDRNLIGFSNTSRAFLAIVQGDGTVLRMEPEWIWLKNKKAWCVTCRESFWNHSADEFPVWTDQTGQLKTVLSEIREFALAIKEPFFADCFLDAYNLLNGKDPANNNVLFHDLPAPYGNIINAVSRADVFGAMGSWNDSPPFEAKSIGREHDYERLSDALLHLIRVNLMYAVNTCYSQE